MKILDRQKLDVVNKTRSNLFGWRGQFTPEFRGEGRGEGRGLHTAEQQRILLP